MYEYLTQDKYIAHDKYLTQNMHLTQDFTDRNFDSIELIGLRASEIYSPLLIVEENMFLSDFNPRPYGWQEDVLPELPLDQRTPRYLTFRFPRDDTDDGQFEW